MKNKITIDHELLYRFLDIKKGKKKMEEVAHELCVSVPALSLGRKQGVSNNMALTISEWIGAPIRAFMPGTRENGIAIKLISAVDMAKADCLKTNVWYK